MGPFPVAALFGVAHGCDNPISVGGEIDTREQPKSTRGSGNKDDFRGCVLHCVALWRGRGHLDTACFSFNATFSHSSSGKQ